MQIRTMLVGLTPTGAIPVAVLLVGQRLPVEPALTSQVAPVAPAPAPLNTQQIGSPAYRTVAERIAALPIPGEEPNPFGDRAGWEAWSNARSQRQKGLLALAAEMDEVGERNALEHKGEYKVHPDGFVEKLTGQHKGLGYRLDPRTGCCTCRRGVEVHLVRREMALALCGTACRCRHDHLREMAGLSLSHLLEEVRTASERRAN